MQLSLRPPLAVEPLNRVATPAAFAEGQDDKYDEVCVYQLAI